MTGNIGTTVFDTDSRRQSGYQDALLTLKHTGFQRPMTRYFFYNTDRRALRGPPLPRFPMLLQHHFAALGGDIDLFGSQFAQLNETDTLLMYENGVGVVAIGSVLEKWNRIQYRNPRYYTKDELKDLTGGEREQDH